mmetsp:Transcript_47286/g.156761  ORF Transcript_47286/g.156761 Transcript_47286/m.156761 type:complete len:213 (+) Transcript_47286:450-1088(+)
MHTPEEAVGGGEANQPPHVHRRRLRRVRSARRQHGRPVPRRRRERVCRPERAQQLQQRREERQRRVRGGASSMPRPIGHARRGGEEEAEARRRGVCVCKGEGLGQQDPAGHEQRLQGSLGKRHVDGARRRERADTSHAIDRAEQPTHCQVPGAGRGSVRPRQQRRDKVLGHLLRRRPRRRRQLEPHCVPRVERERAASFLSQPVQQRRQDVA